MSPLILLFAVMGLTGVALVVELVRRRRVHRALRQLALEQGMHFSRRDQLRLTSRVATHLPIPGAAYVRVIDLMYGSGGGRHRYVFTAEYTVGVLRSKKRCRRAATFSEPRQRCDASPCSAINLGPVDLPLIEQYRALLGVAGGVEEAAISKEAGRGGPMQDADASAV